MLAGICLLALLALPVAAQEYDDVIRAVAAMMRSRYVLPEAGARAAAELERDLASRRWPQAMKPEEFATSVTQRLRGLTDDGHLSLGYSAKALREETAEAEKEFSAEETERFYGAHLNYGFERVERLEGNIGYLDLRVFAPVSMAGDVAAAAMTLLAQSDALIIDSRNNGGGHEEMVGLLAAYLFDAPQPLSGKYHRPTDTRTYSVTPAWVPGRRFGPDKPVYVLISRKTFSAAEAFAYDLKALKRVTVVGERSGGGAHPFEYRRVHPHFVLSLAEGRSINPITGGNWQGTGVEPDVAVPGERALEAALELARGAVRKAK
jgi:C-terminal processing protease CtpA/Prc